MNWGKSPQKVFSGPQTRRGLSGECRGNLWVCFISESEAVEKLLQTPWPEQRVGSAVIHGGLPAQTETVDVCLCSCVLFLPLLNTLSYTWNPSLFPPVRSPSPPPEQLKTRLIKKSPPTHQQLVLCPWKRSEVFLSFIIEVFHFFLQLKMGIGEIFKSGENCILLGFIIWKWNIL